MSGPCIHSMHLLHAKTTFIVDIIGVHHHSVDWGVRLLSSPTLCDTRGAVWLVAGFFRATCFAATDHESRTSEIWKREVKIFHVFVLRILTMLWEFCFRDLRRWIRQEWVTHLAMVNHGLLYLQSTLFIFYFGYLNISDYMNLVLFVLNQFYT